MSIVLGLMAGTVQLLGYYVYNRGAGDKINTGSWSIWALAGVVDLVSYFAMTGDWVINFLPAVCAVAAFGTFCYAIYRKRFSWPDRWDRIFLGVDGLITVVWVLTNAVFANLLYQLSTVLSFIPMYRWQFAGGREKALPWLIWAFAYVLLTASVLLRLNRWEELVYPVSHALTHLAVALIAIAQRKTLR